MPKVGVPEFALSTLHFGNSYEKMWRETICVAMSYCMTDNMQERILNLSAFYYHYSSKETNAHVTYYNFN